MKQYIVDAFTDKVFGGNPAAVCTMDSWPSDDLMMNITVENNLSETAFAVREGSRYRLRWFTPGGEIDPVSYTHLFSVFSGTSSGRPWKSRRRALSSPAKEESPDRAFYSFPGRGCDPY